MRLSHTDAAHHEPPRKVVVRQFPRRSRGGRGNLVNGRAFRRAVQDERERKRRDARAPRHRHHTLDCPTHGWAYYIKNCLPSGLRGSLGTSTLRNHALLDDCL